METQYPNDVVQEEEDVTQSQSSLYGHDFELKPGDIRQEPKTVAERVDEEVCNICDVRSKMIKKLV